MSFHLHPVVTIGDDTYSTDTYNAAKNLPTSGGGPAQPIADLSINWGRSSMFDAPESQTATVTLYAADPAALYDWDPIGQLLKITANRTDNTYQRHLFTGVVTAAKMTTRSDDPGDDFTHGGRYLELTATSLRALLENTPCPVDSLPDNLETRALANRILTYFPDPYRLLTKPTPIGVIPLEGGVLPQFTGVKGRSLASLLDDIYQSGGAEWEYWPSDSQIQSVPTNTRSAPRQLVLKPSDVARNQDHELLIQVVNNYSGGIGHDAAIPGRYTTSSGEMSRSSEDIITSVRVKWEDLDSTGKMVEKVTTVKSELRQSAYFSSDMELTSLAWWEEYVQMKAANVIKISDLLRRGWRPPPMTYSTRLSGGFGSIVESNSILQPWANNERVFLSSQLSSRLDPTPVYHNIIGGTIRYYRDRPNHPGFWDVDMSMIPIVNRHDYQRPIIWTEIPPVYLTTKCTWNRPSYRINSSVSWDDLRLVSKEVTT